MALEAENIKKYADEQEVRAAQRGQKRKEANAALARVQENLAIELEEKQRYYPYASENPSKVVLMFQEKRRI